MTLTFGGLVAGLLAVALVVATARLVATRRRLRALGEGELAALRREVARLERARDELDRLCVTDPLTGVRNYRYLQLALDREVQRAGRFGRPFAVLMLDVDDFREVNRRHGHAVAGGVLRAFAQRVAVEVREADTVCRYGGEEFVVLLPETGADGAACVAERLAYAVRRECFGPAGEPVRLSVSVGVAVHPRDGDHATTLLRAADRDLARAKSRRGHAGHGAEAGTGPAMGPGTRPGGGSTGGAGPPAG